MKRDLEYYMNLPYRIEIQELSDHDGGGILLCMPELGRAVVTGCGDTLEEAKESLRTIQRDVLSMWIEQGTAIPLPDSMNTYSGKLSLRISPALHRTIAERAREQEYSINQFITIALEKEVVLSSSNRSTSSCKDIPSMLYESGAFSYSEPPCADSTKEGKCEICQQAA